MQIFVILALIIAILAVVFALQNNALAVVTFLAWKFNGSLALVLLVAVLVGVLISLLVSLPNWFRDQWRLRNHRKKISELETSLETQKTRLAELEMRIKELTTAPVLPLSAAGLTQQEAEAASGEPLAAASPPLAE